MNKQSAVSALQSRIAKRQNELRRLNREREETKKELAGSPEGFHRSFLLNDYRYIKAEIHDLVGEQILDKTLQRGMTLLNKSTRKYAKLLCQVRGADYAAVFNTVFDAQGNKLF